MKRTLFPFALSLLFVAIQPQAAESHWLVGVWSGQIQSQNPNRTLLVNKVAPSGQVEGGWGTKPDPTIGSAEITTTEDTVDVHVLTSDSRVALHRSGTDQLLGVMTLKSGKQIPVLLTRGESTFTPAIMYEGTLYASSRGGCFANTTMFKVFVGANEAKGEWGYDSGRHIRFSAPSTDSGFKAERVTSQETDQIQGTKTAAGYNISVSGPGCELTGKIKSE